MTVDCNSGKTFVFGFFRKLIMGSASAIIGGPKHIISCKLPFFLFINYELGKEKRRRKGNL